MEREQAKIWGVEVAAILAVKSVESSGDGLLPTGEPKILFERHQFYRLLSGKFGKPFADDVMRKYPNLCNTVRGGYYGGQREHTDRLQPAVKIDRDCALQATSWGAYQVMGFNWNTLGYGSMQAFINDMYAGEPGQFRGFCRFIEAFELVDELQRKDWAGFARVYNGPKYREGDYDGKMAAAYRKFASQGNSA